MGSMTLLGAGKAPAIGGSYQTETTSIIARIDTLNGGSDPAWLNSTRKTAIDALVIALKSGPVSGSNIWAKLDLLYIEGNGDANGAGVNWKNPGTNDLSIIGSPTFTSDRGYDGNATNTNALGTGFNASTAGGNYAQDAAHLGVWLLESSASANYDLGTSGTSELMRNANGTGRININNANQPVTLGASLGHTVGVRISSSQMQPYQDGVAKTIASVASVALVNANFELLRAVGITSDRQQMAAHFGGLLTANEVLDVYNALAAWKTAVGA